MSLDGFIAGENDDLSFLDAVQQEGEDYGYDAFMRQVQTVVLGRKTYDKVVSMVGEYPAQGKEVYVFTRQNRPQMKGVRFVSEAPNSFVQGLKKRKGGHIFVDGGADIWHVLLLHGLIDECYFSIVPVFLGKGVPLFRDGRPPQTLRLSAARTYPSGLVQLHYKFG